MNILFIFLAIVILGYWGYVMRLPEPFMRSKIINEYGILFLIIGILFLLLGILL